jgi:TRAP-type uncharacterized transport system fused permease subunit
MALVYQPILIYRDQMTINSLLPPIAGLAFILYAGCIALDIRFKKKRLWILPCILSALFLAFSIYAIATEGLFGFWAEHVDTIWGNQIWLDLLFAVGIGWFLVVPRAKEYGMRPVPWLFFVICTGCIGFMAMISRLLYLEENSERRA